MCTVQYASHMPKRLTLDDHRERAQTWLAFIEEHGRQPGNRPEAPPSESALYYWINKLRKAESAMTLSAEVRAVLNEEAPTWRTPADPARPDPELHTRRAHDYRRFGEKHGRKPSQLARGRHERQLQHWMTNQRAALAQGTLHPEVREAISAALPGWDAPSAKQPREHKTPIPFAERIVALKAYMDENSGMLPPSNGGDGPDGSLGRWLAQQRRLWRRGELKRARKRALDGLTPTWTHERRNEAKWGLRAQQLAEFFAEHDRLPRSTRADEDERRLNAWLHVQRDAELTDEQITTLNAAVPTWRGEGVPSGWAHRTREIQHFIRDEGHRPRPQGATPEERRMGFWLTRQRKALREGRLSEAAATMLEEALPGWETPDTPAPPTRRSRVPAATPNRGSGTRKRLPTDRRSLIDLAQLDVTNRHPSLAAEDPYRYARKVVNRYVRLATTAGLLQKPPAEAPVDNE